MVVLSVALLTRSGKCLVARQFVDMARLRLEGLLAAFPKLLDGGNNNSSTKNNGICMNNTNNNTISSHASAGGENKIEELYHGGNKRQHTFIDTESVRYVYQPLDHFFLLLITNKTSNIVQDLQSLQLLSKIIPDVCGHLTEESIKQSQFDLVFAFDEALTAGGGHAEHISLSQIRTNMEMESHEEKLHIMIQQSKKNAAKTEAKRQQQRLKTEQRERARIERATGGMSSVTSSTSSRMGNGGYASASSSSSTSYGENSSAGGYSKAATSYAPAPPVASKSSGMKLGGAKKGKNFMDAMMSEDDLTEVPMAMAEPSSNENEEENQTDAVNAPVQESTLPIVTSLEEKISVLLTREGTIDELEVKGTLFVHSNDPESALCRLKMNYTKSGSGGINYQVHPKIDKKLFEKEGILGLKVASKPFPEARVGVLRWLIKSTEESMLPLNLTCWPEDDGNGKFTVNIEYNLEREEMELSNVKIKIPLGSSDPPQVLHIDGDYRHDSNNGCLLWHHDTINSENSSGSLEFNVRANDMDVFFPTTLSFFSESTYADFSVESVLSISDNTPVENHFSKLLTTEDYTVE